MLLLFLWDEWPIIVGAECCCADQFYARCFSWSITPSQFTFMLAWQIQVTFEVEVQFDQCLFVLFELLFWFGHSVHPIKQDEICRDNLTQKTNEQSKIPRFTPIKQKMSPNMWIKICGHFFPDSIFWNWLTDKVWSIVKIIFAANFLVLHQILFGLEPELTTMSEKRSTFQWDGWIRLMIIICFKICERKSTTVSRVNVCESLWFVWMDFKFHAFFRHCQCDNSKIIFWDKEYNHHSRRHT